MRKAFILFLICMLAFTGCSKDELDSRIENPDGNVEIHDNEINEDPSAEKERLGFINGNISSGGLMCRDGEDWVYYRSEADSWYLYKARFDGSEKTKICEDVPEGINVMDDRVYYCNFLDGFSIYRVGADGNGREKLVDGYCSNLRVTSDKMYFDMRDDNNASHIYSANLDGSQFEPVTSDKKLVAYYNGILYCSDVDKLYSMNLANGELKTLFDGYVHYVSVDDNGIYFWGVDEGCFYRLSEDGSKTVLHRGGDFYNYTDGKLYYQHYGGENNDYDCIYRFDVEYGETEAVLSLSTQCFDSQGEDLGITLGELRGGLVIPDESMLNSTDGIFDIFTEHATSIYVIDEYIFSRGVLKESISQTGKFDCWIQCDGAHGKVWD